MNTVPYVCFSKTSSAIVLGDDGRRVLQVPIGTLKMEWVVSTKFFKEYTRTNFPVQAAIGHYLAETCFRPFDRATVEELKRGFPTFLMPQHITVGQQQELQGKIFLFSPEGRRLGVATMTSHLPNATPPEEEQDPMATAKKPTATEKKAATKKPAAAKKPAATEKKAPAAKAKAAPAEKTSGRKPGVGALIRAGLLAGKEAEAIVAEIRKQFPESKSEAKDVAWYRSKMKRDGDLK